MSENPTPFPFLASLASPRGPGNQVIAKGPDPLITRNEILGFLIFSPFYIFYVYCEQFSLLGTYSQKMLRLA